MANKGDTAMICPLLKMTDARSHHYHEFNSNRQNWAIDRWCRGLRISRIKLERHPHFEDVVTLLMFDSWQNHMNQSDRDIWRHCWQWSYHRQLPLSGHHKTRLLNIVDGLDYRHQAYEKRKLKRQHIKARLDRRQLAAV
jgi:hypothetical protein